MKFKRLDDSLKRAALYSRVSTEEQALHGVSLDAQRERLTEYAKENNLIVVDHYTDEGISARKKYTGRPEFMRMIADVKAKKIDVILFVKLDRWFRNIADYYEVQAILDENKVQWIATEEEYDTTTANGRLALNIKLAIAQDESDRTSERIKFVFGNMVKEGRVISGNTPLGFKIENKRAVIDEEKAPVVREAFDKYIDCRSMKATARHILDKYNISIDPKSMKHMLTNTWYVGEAYGIKGWCPAIIEEKTFQLVNSILETRGARGEGTRTDRVYLFTGLVFCSACGRRMTTYCNANKKPDGTTTMYRVTVWDDEGNTRVSTPSNQATVLGPSVNTLQEQGLNYSFDNGLSGWTEFGENGLHYTAKALTVDGKKVLELKLNHSTNAAGEVVLGQDWFGVHMDDIKVKPNVQYELKVTYKIAPDALFKYEESTEANKMSGYLILRSEFTADALAQTYLQAGNKTEWRTESITFKTDDSGKLCLDLRAVQFNGTPIHYYIDSIELYEVK